MADVLIVDDEEEICSLLCDALEKDHIEVQCALTGESALQLIEQENFKVCIVDMKLSTSVRGVDVIKGIRAKRPKALVAAMSGFIDPSLKLEAEQSGAVDHFEKPADLKEEIFREKVKALLAQTIARR